MSSIVLLACGCATARVDAQATPYNRYRLETFTTADGLPSNATTDIAATSDGYLWIAAGGLLTRFDGLEFRTYGAGRTPGFPRRIHALLVGAGDVLWVLDDVASVLTFARGKATVVAAGSAPFSDLAQVGPGGVVGRRGPVWSRIRGASAGQHDTGENTAATAGLLSWRSPDGTLWILDQEGGAKPLVDDGDSPAPHGEAPLLVASPSRRMVYEVRRRGAMRDVVTDRDSVVATYMDRPGAIPRLVDRHGRLWVSVPGGTEILEPGNSVPVVRLPLALRRFVEAADGCVWSVNAGLHRTCPVPFHSVATHASPSGLSAILSVAPGPSDTVLTIDTRGTLWSTTLDAQSVIEPSGTAGRPPIFAALTDTRGTVWWTRAGALEGRRHDGRRVVIAGHSSVPMANEPGSDAVIWTTDQTHLYRVDLRAPRQARVTDSIAHGATYTKLLGVSRKRVVWVVLQDALFNERMLRIENGKATAIPFDGVLLGTQVRSILPDDDGTVWLGTYGAGLVRYRDGRFRAVQERDGLAENVVTGVLEDAAGNFWMGGNRSIHRVPRAQVEAFLDGRVARVYGSAYDRSDGIEDPETNGAPGIRDGAGRFWFPTLDGLAVVDPSFALSLDDAAPPVRVRSIRSERDTIAVEDAPLGLAPVQLTRGARRLVIGFGAIALQKARGTRYEYRTDGVDDRWVDVGTERTATYHNIGPGTYTFRVRAISAGGRIGDDEATLAFVVPAYFHETRAFLAAMLLATGLLAWLAYRARVGHLRRRAADFSLQLDERTRDLSVALQTVALQADNLRALDDAKSRFFANVSHEFRTPLSLILGPADSIARGEAGAVPAEAARQVDMMAGNARRLLQLVDQLLDATRLEAGKLQLNVERRDVIPLVRRMADSFSSLAARRGITFRLSCPVGGLWIDHDADQLEKIIGNLVGNALKFTPSGGLVEVRVRIDPGDDTQVLIEVEDSGPGIAPQHQARVFERFYQVDDSPRRSHDGIGIGLALTKELVELHGGDISLRSQPGGGCTFVVRLPAVRVTGEAVVAGPVAFARPPHEQTNGHAPPTVAATNGTDADESASRDEPTVLVVEDNVELLEFLRGRLSSRYRVLAAENGAVALELARRHVPDLIVSDVMMPVMDGQSLCEAVKADPDIDFIPVILLTAKASRDSRLSGLSGGADDYLSKPADLDELMTRADNLIASRRRVRERFEALNTPLPVASMALHAAPRDASTTAMMQKVNEMLSAHLSDSDFQVEQMGVALGMGRSTLYRKLRKELGKSPMDVLFDYRLAQAAQWLSETPITVSEVAYGVGFRSVPHFCTKFRERYGETPTAYRQAHTTSSGSTR